MSALAQHMLTHCWPFDWRILTIILFLCSPTLSEPRMSSSTKVVVLLMLCCSCWAQFCQRWQHQRQCALHVLEGMYMAVWERVKVFHALACGLNCIKIFQFGNPVVINTPTPTHHTQCNFMSLQPKMRLYKCSVKADWHDLPSQRIFGFIEHSLICLSGSQLHPDAVPEVGEDAVTSVSPPVSLTAMTEEERQELHEELIKVRRGDQGSKSFKNSGNHLGYVHTAGLNTQFRFNVWIWFSFLAVGITF